MLLYALVDTGCSQSIVSADLVKVQGGSRNVVAVDNRVVHGVAETEVELMVGKMRLTVTCLAMKDIVSDLKVIIGMDVIRRVGGVAVDGNGNVRFGSSLVGTVMADGDGNVRSGTGLVGTAMTDGDKCGRIKDSATVVEIADKDFEARFDGSK